jgi:hypothetical protein
MKKGCLPVAPQQNKWVDLISPREGGHSLGANSESAASCGSRPTLSKCYSSDFCARRLRFQPPAVDSDDEYIHSEQKDCCDPAGLRLNSVWWCDQRRQLDRRPSPPAQITFLARGWRFRESSQAQ